VFAMAKSNRLAADLLRTKRAERRKLKSVLCGCRAIYRKVQPSSKLAQLQHPLA